jgi:hypothetical protein
LHRAPAPTAEEGGIAIARHEAEVAASGRGEHRVQPIPFGQILGEVAGWQRDHGGRQNALLAVGDQRLASVSWRCQIDGTEKQATDVLHMAVSKSLNSRSSSVSPQPYTRWNSGTV